MDRNMDKKNMGKPYLKIIVLVAILGCLLPGPLLGEPAEEIVYRQKWLLNTSVVGGLYAQTRGLFRDAGLAVTIKAGGPERDAIRELELGYAHFGVASADQVIRALAKGAPVVVLAQIFQRNPLQWAYYDDGPVIERLGDLKGKTIGITFGGNDETIMRTLMASGGLRETDVRLFSVRYDYTPFFKRRVDIWPVYRNTQAIILSEKLEKNGESLRFLDPAEFGVRFVANSVVTSRRLLDTRPDTVRRFTTVLLAGWQQALAPANREKALNSIRQFDRDTSLPILDRQLAVTRALVHPRVDVPIGTIDGAAWTQTEEIMRAQAQISRPAHVHRALYPVGRPLTQPGPR